MSTAKIKEDIEEEDLERSERDDAISSLSRELQIIKKGKSTYSPAPDKSAKLMNQPWMSPGSNLSKKKLDNSIGKKSIHESDVDGLLKWAGDLPDDISVNAGQSFYQNMLNKTLHKQESNI